MLAVSDFFSPMATVARLDLRQAALLALGLSLLTYALGAWLGWALTRRLGPEALRPRWLVHTARFCYYVLFPYLFLLRGLGLLPAALGLVGPEPPAQSVLGWSTGWLEGLLWAMGGAAAAWLLLAWSVRAVRRGAEAVPAARAGQASRAEHPGASEHAGDGRPAVGTRPAVPQPHATRSQPAVPLLPRGWALVREVVFQQAHWAFYRAALAVWLGAYGALFISLALVAGEIALDPRTWASLRQPERAAGLIVTAAMAWLSAGVFLFTGNFWLTAAAHLLALGGLAAIASRLAPDEDRLVEVA
jgi:hypothetical protein